MKKLLFLMLVLGLTVFSTPAGALMLVVDIDPQGFSDKHLGAYWTGDDFNNGMANNLINASEDTVAGWLQYGLLNNTVTITNYIRWNEGEGALGSDQKTLNINTHSYLDWEYAVVKWNGYWVAYYDNDKTDILEHPFGFSPDKLKGVSNITFLNVTPVPEPATMLLLGSGLIGLSAFGRKRITKS